MPNLSINFSSISSSCTKLHHLYRIKSCRINFMTHSASDASLFLAQQQLLTSFNLRCLDKVPPSFLQECQGGGVDLRKSLKARQVSVLQRASINHRHLGNGLFDYMWSNNRQLQPHWDRQWGLECLKWQLCTDQTGQLAATIITQHAFFEQPEFQI